MNIPESLETTASKRHKEEKEEWEEEENHFNMKISSRLFGNFFNRIKSLSASSSSPPPPPPSSFSRPKVIIVK